MPHFLPSPLRTRPREAAPNPENIEAIVARIARQMAFLQAENAKLRKALADERIVASLMLRIDRLGEVPDG